MSSKNKTDSYLEKMKSIAETVWQKCKEIGGKAVDLLKDLKEKFNEINTAENRAEIADKFKDFFNKARKLVPVYIPIIYIAIISLIIAGVVEQSNVPDINVSDSDQTVISEADIPVAPTTTTTTTTTAKVSTDGFDSFKRYLGDWYLHGREYGYDVGFTLGFDGERYYISNLVLNLYDRSNVIVLDDPPIYLEYYYDDIEYGDTLYGYYEMDSWGNSGEIYLIDGEMLDFSGLLLSATTFETTDPGLALNEYLTRCLEEY